MSIGNSFLGSTVILYTPLLEINIGKLTLV